MSAELGSWESAEYVEQWLGEDVVAALLDLPRKISVALVRDAGIDVSHVVDLGSGHGPYLELMLDEFPGARGTWVDLSPAMEAEARARLERFGERIRYLVTDVEQLAEGDLEPASVVVSSRALHHLAHEKLEQLYARLAGVVEPGGYLFNLDHVGAPGDLERAYRRIRKQFLGERKQELKPHRQDAPLARADEHLAWVGRAGFENADTPWRTLYTALIAARRPAS